jgi:hypothetical protein
MLFLKQQLFDYLKLTEKSIVMVLDNMVDKWCFSIMSFIRSKHINRLPTYFDLVVKMFIQNHCSMYIFPFVDAIKD